MYLNKIWYIKAMAEQPPDAFANIVGVSSNQNIHGIVTFYTILGGVIVCTEVYNLPIGCNIYKSKVLGFHIHEGQVSSENQKELNLDTLGHHYNPCQCPHPYHAGDLPPLFSNNGYALMGFVTNRFTVKEIIGRTIVIHDSPDDFTTQPSGNSGKIIAIGEIERNTLCKTNG